jgi:hypothetical protein
MATKKLTQAQKIRNYSDNHPIASTTEIANKMGLRYQTVYQVLKPSVKVPKQFKWKHVTVATSDESLEGVARLEANRIFELTKGRDRVEMIEPQADSVNHPAHYKVGGIETIDFIEAKGLNYHLGNVVKYITRADTKGSREEDLLKARWYLNREIAKLGK